LGMIIVFDDRNSKTKTNRGSNSGSPVCFV
jgi:hypothetical protein